MDFTSLSTIIGIIILLAVSGLLKPLRTLFSSFGSDIEVINEVKARLVKEWDADSAIQHAKKMNQVYTKAEDLGVVRTYEDVMKTLKAKHNKVEED